jgi:lipoprotein signal peptidase
MPAPISYIVYGYGGGVILLITDFLTKYLANSQLLFEKPIKTILPFLFFYLTHNTGYHFLFGAIRNQLLWAVSGLVFVVILVFSLSRSILKETLDKGNRIIYTIVLSLAIGALGNVFEILFRGYATDFFIFRPFPWPSNICDQYINGILYIMLPIMIIKSLLDHRKEKASTKTKINPTQ